MRVTSTQSYNKTYPSYNLNTQMKNSANPQFTGRYDQFTEWIANNYYKKFYNSKFAAKFLEKTKGPKWDNMTTHMSALGSTLISGMYVFKTLTNDKLDQERRKTLALNDLMTWGVSTAGAYFLDSKLANWWDGVTTRFAANYLLDNKDAKRADLFGEWHPKDLKDMMKNWHEKIKPDSTEAKELVESLGKKAYSNIRDFNLDILKDRKLTTLIDGMGVLKSLFVFGMVYRYIVPVLVMKPANMIGRYFHNKNNEKNQAEIKK